MKNWLREIFKNKEQKKLEHILSRHYGGIYKRIDENRELLELLQAEAPEFLARHFWVSGWIGSTDGFLNDLERLGVAKETQFRQKSEGTPFPRTRHTLMRDEPVCGVCKSI